MGFDVCFWVYRCSRGAEADLCVYTAEGRDWSEAVLWSSRGAGLSAAGHQVASTDAGPLWNLQWKSTRWLPVSKYFPLTDQCWECHFTWLYLCLYRSPAGMIEGTPQLHANAWKVSSACVAPVNLPIVDPCEMNQNNGNNGFILHPMYLFFLPQLILGKWKGWMVPWNETTECLT